MLQSSNSSGRFGEYVAMCLREELQRKTSSVAAPAVQAEHFASPQLCELGILVHAAPTYLL
jgi:hypothetical protein